MFRRHKHIVFCEGCANLFYIEGAPPSCIATAEYIYGPLRSKIDMGGITSAEKRNRRNNCKLRSSVSLSAWDKKKWLLWRLSNGSDEEIRESKLYKYPISTEAENRKKVVESDYLEDISKQEIDDIVESLKQEDHGEAVGVVGRVEDDEHADRDQGSGDDPEPGESG